MHKLSLRIIRSLLFALSVGLIPILALWRYNLGQIAPHALGKPLLITIAFVLISFTFGLLIGRSWEKASLFSAIYSLFFFTFGHLYNFLGVITIVGLSFGYLKQLVLCLVFFLVVVVLVLRYSRPGNSFFLIGNIIAGILIIFNLIPTIAYAIQIQQALKQASVEEEVSPQAALSTQPDIYFIILDAYAREDVLQEVINYDNSEFLSALQERGFYIPECAYSNYDGTLKALTSILNMDYLNNLDVDISDQEGFAASNDNLFINNKIRSLMHGYGYQFVTGRGHSSVVDINNSDLYFNYWQNQKKDDDLDAQRFASLYFNTTALRVISEIYKDNPAKVSWLPYWIASNRESEAYLAEATYWYYQNNYMFDSMESIPQRQGNYFVYAHIIAPHGPYVYRADGSFNYPLDSNDEKVLYAEAVTYLNKRVLELVDTLQSESDVEPIIIIQSDHAIHQMSTGLEKHKILSAYYLPGTLTTPPYATLTPVNNFRIIIRNYFDPSMELLPDILYVRLENNPEPVDSSCELH